jgi:hypothetical protein
MSDPHHTPAPNDPLAPSRDSDGEPAPDEETEFRVTVRKLELPVQPRGVLAD